MTVYAIIGGRVLLEDEFVDDQAILVADGHIAAFVPRADLPSGVALHDVDGHIVVPGFIDSQVNGGGGVLFNETPTVAAIAAIGAAHRRFGTTGFLPTLISDDLTVVRHAIAAVEQSIAAKVPGVLGIHIEGPFLNVDRKGIHDPAKFRLLDDEGFETLTSLKSGRTLVTLAPECTTPAMIRRLADAGVIVAAGHTNGSYRDLRTALDNGLTGFTHLFNAMSPLTSREPGAVGAALEDVHSWCGLIVDGRHVDPVTLRIALRCRPLNRFMLVTDAMPSVGLVEKTFQLQGNEVRVIDGVCVDANGTLAGSDLDMASAVRRSLTMLDVPLPVAIRMASAYPADFLGVSGQLGTIRPGQRASLVALNRELLVVGTWIDGLYESVR